MSLTGFVPPFVLVKILTFGVASSYYGLLKQSDRQAIAKYFKISDKLLKQILKNLTTIRNVAAHSDRLYNYTKILSSHSAAFLAADAILVIVFVVGQVDGRTASNRGAIA